MSARWHQRGRRIALMIAVLGSLASIALLALMLVPGLRSARAAETADGTRAFGIGIGIGAGAGGGGSAIGGEGAVAEVTPAAGWSVRPDPGGPGLILRSPDGLFEARLAPTSTEVADAALSAAIDAAETATEADASGSAAGARVAVETLAGGLELRHVTVGRSFVGVLGLGGAAGHADAILVSGETAPTADPERYRPALGALLESITDG